MVVRTDSDMNEKFSKSDKWSNQSDTLTLLEPCDGGTKVNSQSGHERNHLFINNDKGEFHDASLLSGVDSLADSRANAFLDLNHDGWQDIAMVNANDPFLQLFENQFGQLKDPQNGFVAIRLIGGNSSPESSEEWSSRDAIGAVVTLNCGEKTLVRELRAGEGFASQNSKTLLIGLGTESQAELTVRWPSGNVSEYGGVTAGNLVTCYEDPRQTFDRKGIMAVPYVPAETMLASDDSPQDVFKPLDSDAQLNVFVSMATWCANCKKNQPQVRTISRQFGDKIGLYGIPVDADDTVEKLEKYQSEYSPAYEIVQGLNEDVVNQMKDIVTRRSGQGALPSTIVTDREGNVLHTYGGVPSVSDLNKLLDRFTGDLDENESVEQN